MGQFFARETCFSSVVFVLSTSKVDRNAMTVRGRAVVIRGDVKPTVRSRCCWGALFSQLLRERRIMRHDRALTLEQRPSFCSVPTPLFPPLARAHERGVCYTSSENAVAGIASCFGVEVCPGGAISRRVERTAHRHTPDSRPASFSREKTARCRDLGRLSVPTSKGLASGESSVRQQAEHSAGMALMPFFDSHLTHSVGERPCITTDLLRLPPRRLP